MQAMTRKELSLLTMKQIREYAVIKGATKVPKKWQDKGKALDWVEKNVKVTAKKVTKKKATSKDDKQAIARRHGMVLKLRKEECTVSELKDNFKNEYKSVLDDLHAIRHNRGGEDYLEKDEILLGVYIGKCKVFKVVKAKNEDSAKNDIKNNIKVE